jgi:hypothetical protein
MKYALVILIAAFSTQAMAFSYRCEVEQDSDYLVEVNLRKGRAGFFDNNSWSVIGVKNGTGGATFEGRDNEGSGLKIFIDNNEMNPQSYVIYQTDGLMVKSRIDCRFELDLALNKRI